MPKKKAKSTKSTKATKPKSTTKYSPKDVLCRPSTWISALLLLALLVIYGVANYGFTHIQPKTNLDIAKLEVFDNLIQEKIRSSTITNDAPSVKEATGYGISDEDGVFYVTFDYVTYDMDANQTPSYGDLKHGIMYFWKDAERGTYSNAYSYHDDYYHPGGVYVEIGNHDLRSQLAPANE